MTCSKPTYASELLTVALRCLSGNKHRFRLSLTLADAGKPILAQRPTIS